MQAFLKPFNWTVWLAMLLNAAFVPLVLYVVENVVMTGSIPLGWSLISDWCVKLLPGVYLFSWGFMVLCQELAHSRDMFDRIVGKSHGCGGVLHAGL